MLLSMATGLACGMGYLTYGVIVAVFLGVVMFALAVFKFGQQKKSLCQLKITIPENLDYRQAFDDILKRYTVSYQKARVRTSDLGSLYELQYMIIIKDNMNEKAMLDELRCRNGNLDIAMVLAPQLTEQF